MATKVTKPDVKKMTAKENVVSEVANTQVVSEPAGNLRPIVHPKLGILERSTTSKDGPIEPWEMEEWLGWTTEEQYQKEMLEEDPDGKPEHYIYGDDYHCMDASDDDPKKCQKVRCEWNANNRPFDQKWSEKLADMLLQGQWAGPLTCPGETVNGETIRISKYGRVLSGQHQGTALIIADQKLQRAREKESKNDVSKYPFWDGHKHVVLETIVVIGLSEDERILRTIDYVKPRTIADMLYTMELYRKNTPPERKELTRMLAQAIETFWWRTNVLGYKTHPEVVGLLERHKRLLDCVEVLFTLNSAKGVGGGRKISKLRLSPGVCAALLYLMGCSGDDTDGDEYRNMTPPDEKVLDWSLWERANLFWSRLASDTSFEVLRTVLKDLKETKPNHEDEDKQGLGGRAEEKLAILSAAWEIFKDHPDDTGPPFNDDDKESGGALDLAYTDLDEKGNKLPNNEWALVNEADFGGIDGPEGAKFNRKDLGTKAKTKPQRDPTPEEIAALAEKERFQKWDKEDQKKDDDKKKREEQTKQRRLAQLRGAKKE